jgi:hypothetical protein
MEVGNPSHHTLLNIIYAKVYFAVEPIFVNSAGMSCTLLRMYCAVRDSSTAEGWATPVHRRAM